MNEAFTAFLHAKRIHAQAWQQSRPEEFLALEQAFLLMGKASFDARKKFIFNELRKEFLWEEAASFKRQAASGETAGALALVSNEDADSDKQKASSEKQPQPEVKKAPPMKLKIPLKKAEEGAGDKPQSASDIAGALALADTEETASGEQPQPEVKKAPLMKLKIPLKKAEESTETPPAP